MLILLKIPNDALDQCKLEVLVYDFDQYSVDECIGRCCLALKSVEMSSDPAQKTVFWAEIMVQGTSKAVSLQNQLVISKQILSSLHKMVY